MVTMSLDLFLADVDRRKAVAGIDEETFGVDALRNNGARRTPEKRAMLAAIAERTASAFLK